MAFTIDNRPTYFGDRMIVTGTYTAGSGAADVSLDLGDLLSSIDFAAINPSAAPAAIGITTTPPVNLNIQDVVQADGTTITLHGGNDGTAGPTTAGSFFVIGRR